MQKFSRIQRHYVPSTLRRVACSALFVPTQHARHNGNIFFNRHIRKQADLLITYSILRRSVTVSISLVFLAVDKNITAAGRDQPD